MYLSRLRLLSSPQGEENTPGSLDKLGMVSLSNQCPWGFHASVAQCPFQTGPGVKSGRVIFRVLAIKKELPCQQFGYDI
jgi:hypothetical protein